VSILFGRRSANTWESWASGDSDAPSALSADKALSLVPFYAAVKLISDALSTMPLHAYSQRSDGARVRIATPRCIATPADGSTTPTWIQRGVVSALVQGNAHAILSGLDRGWPTAATWVSPDEMSYREGDWYWKGRRLDPTEHMHVPAVVVPGKAEGISPVRAFATMLDGASEAQKASRQWSRNRAVPGLKVRNSDRILTPEQADVAAERMKAKLRTGDPFVTGKDWDLDVLSIPTGDAAFLESIKAGATQIASVFNLPPEMIGGSTGASLTYNTTEQQLIQVLTYGLRPWMVRFEAALSKHLMPHPQYVRFNADALIRVDTKTRYETHRIARDIGLNNIDELRELEDLEPLPDGQGQSYEPLAARAATTSTRETP